MKKFLRVCFVSFLALGFLACSDDEDKATVNDYDELPAWLVPQAKELAESFKDFEGDPSFLYSISRATGIHGETVYHIYRAWDSCLMCNLYDEDGNPVVYADVFGERTTAHKVSDTLCSQSVRHFVREKGKTI